MNHFPMEQEQTKDKEHLLRMFEQERVTKGFKASEQQAHQEAKESKMDGEYVMV